MKLLEIAQEWGCTADEAGERISSYDLSERIVFDNRIKIDQFDILAAKIMYMLACCHADPKKSRPKFTDYLPDRRERTELTELEIKSVFAAMRVAKLI